MSFNYSVQLNDPGNLGGSADAVLTYDLQQAIGVWSQYLGGIGSLVVDLAIANTASAREGGAPTSSQFVGKSSNGLNVYEPSSLYELTTGNHVSGTTSDITITVPPSYFQYLDLSANLSYDSQVPSNQYNPIVVFLHELTHGFGWDGWYSQSGVLPGNSESTFDELVQITPAGAAYFTGANAEAVNQGPVRLTTSSTAGENYYHVGNTLSDISKTPSTVQDPLTLDLMNGIVFFFDYQYPISNLDLAVLKDLGYTVTTPPKLVGVGDFNSDGKGDIAWENQDSGTATLWINSGGGFVQTTVPGAAMGPGWTAFGTGDFNGDGSSDLLWTSNTGQVAVWELNGPNLIGFGIPAGQAGPEWQLTGIGDFNGDHKSDLLWVNTNRQVAVWSMNGTALGAVAISNGAAGPEWSVKTTGDFNGDGKSDILWENTSGSVDVWEMNGANLSGLVQNVGALGQEWHVVGTGHFNGDTNSDVVWVNTANQVMIWQMNGGQVGHIMMLNGQDGLEWHLAGIGNFGSDGNSDLLWLRNDGAAHIWAVSGTGVNEIALSTPGGIVQFNSQPQLDVPAQDTFSAQSDLGALLAPPQADPVNPVFAATQDAGLAGTWPGSGNPWLGISPIGGA